MTSALSSHLVEQYYTFHQSRAPFGQPLHASQLSICGPMSFAPQMHGCFPSQPAFSDQSMTSMNAPSFMDMSQATAQNIATLQAKLDKKLGPEFISQRPGPSGGPKLTYAEGWKIINLANEVFGFNGWSSSVVNLNTDFIDFSEETRRYMVGVSAVVRVTLRDGVYHEDVGYGVLENGKSKGAALDKCKKEAVTDGIKRSLRNFGNVLGNCLYDKQYTQEVIKIKVPPTKFDKSTLHRRPEFDESKATAANQPSASSSNASTMLSESKPAVPHVLPKALGVNSYSSVPAFSANTSSISKPMSALPQHMRPSSTSTPGRNMSPQNAHVPAKTGLNTPAHTPLGRSNSNEPTSLPQTDTKNVTTLTPAFSGQAHQNNQPQLQPSKQPPKPIVPTPPIHQQRFVPANPAAPAQQGQQRSKPTPLQELDRQDTYSFASDDDELLAALEFMEGDGAYHELEADIGRPIDSDEGVGRPLDFDEGTRQPVEQSGPIASSGTKTVSDVMSSDFGGIPQGLQQKNQRSIRAVENCYPNCPPRSGQVAQPRQQQQQQQPALKHNASSPGKCSGTGNANDSQDDIADQITALRQQRNAMRKANIALPRSTDGGNAPSSKELPSNSRPRTLSMGGFNFPIGIPGSASSTSAHQQQGMNSQVGMKRNFDALNVPPTSRGPGMGLAQAQAQAGGQNQPHLGRQPLAMFQVEGGDIKRVRR